MLRVAVLAGTKIDTRMGVEYIEKKNEQFAESVIEPVYRPVSEDCDDQVKFQYSDYAAKRRRIDGIFDEEIAAGTRDFFIYCNSLSGAFDFDAYAEDKSREAGFEIRIYTPLQIYRSIGSRFRRPGVIAANNLSAHKIEAALLQGNEDMYVIGSGNMAVVSAIEEGLPAADIVRDYGLEDFVKYITACGCDVLVLGCTHFPYFREEIEKVCSLEIIDPADEMFSALVEK